MKEEAIKRMEQCNLLKDELLELHEKGVPVEGKGVWIKSANGDSFVSGMLYTFSCFSERAFVFKNADQAQEVIDRHQPLLKNFQVHERPAV